MPHLVMIQRYEADDGRFPRAVLHFCTKRLKSSSSLIIAQSTQHVLDAFTSRLRSVRPCRSDPSRGHYHETGRTVRTRLDIPEGFQVMCALAVI